MSIAASHQQNFTVMQQDLRLSVADATIQQHFLSCDQRSEGIAVKQTSACKDFSLFMMSIQVEYERSLHLLSAIVTVFVHALDHYK